VALKEEAVVHRLELQAQQRKELEAKARRNAADDAAADEVAASRAEAEGRAQGARAEKRHRQRENEASRRRRAEHSDNWTQARPASGIKLMTQSNPATLSR